MPKMNYTLHLGDCLEYLPEEVDVIITDPPYPDFNTDHGKDWKYIPVDFLENYLCRQLVFWAADKSFPISYTAKHVWHKMNSQSAHRYEYVYERNGAKSYLLFRHRVITSWLTAQFAQDTDYGHPTQKPIKLMRELIDKFTDPNHLIFDPFMGSGTTGVAAIQLGRRFIGCEINPAYYAIAEKRIAQAALQPGLFTASNLSCTGTATPQGKQPELFTNSLGSDGTNSNAVP